MQNSNKPVIVNKKSIKIIFIFLIGVSLFITVTGLISCFANKNKAKYCTEKVTAVCTKYNIKTIRSRGRTTNNRSYTPVFSYEYNGKKYEVAYGRSYREKNKDTFEVNKEYTIFINPKHPRQFVIEGYENELNGYSLIAPVMGAFSSVFYVAIYCGIRKKLESKDADDNGGINTNEF